MQTENDNTPPRTGTVRSATMTNAFGNNLRLLPLVLAALPHLAFSRNQTLIGMHETPTNAKIQDTIRRTNPTRRN